MKQHLQKNAHLDDNITLASIQPITLINHHLQPSPHIHTHNTHTPQTPFSILKLINNQLKINTSTHPSSHKSNHSNQSHIIIHRPDQTTYSASTSHPATSPKQTKTKSNFTRNQDQTRTEPEPNPNQYRTRTRDQAQSNSIRFDSIQFNTILNSSLGKTTSVRSIHVISLKSTSHDKENPRNIPPKHVDHIYAHRRFLPQKYPTSTRETNHQHSFRRRREPIKTWTIDGLDLTHTPLSRPHRSSRLQLRYGDVPGVYRG